jgi:glycosyl transferase, family 25
MIQHSSAKMLPVVREGTEGRDLHQSARGGGRGLEPLADFFDRIYVVTIERNADRREKLDRELHRLPVTYVYGVDGSKLTETEIREAYDDELARKTFGRSLSAGQIGCALSHRMIYQDVVDKGYDRVLILEDDASPAIESSRWIGPILSQLPEDWDLLYFFTSRPAETRILDLKVRYLYPFLARMGVGNYSMDAIRRTYSRPYSSNLRVAGQHWFALAYAVTRATAARMIRLQTPIRTVADDVTRLVCATDGIKAFLAVPNIFVPRPGVDSTIWNRPPRSRGSVPAAPPQPGPSASRDRRTPDESTF